MPSWILLVPFLAAHVGVLGIAAVFLAETSMPEEYVLFLLVLMCILLF
jgi:hypothetical protein